MYSAATISRPELAALLVRVAAEAANSGLLDAHSIAVRAAEAGSNLTGLDIEEAIEFYYEEYV